MLHQEVLLRVQGYREDNLQYTIALDESFRSDLASYRAYGTAELRWVFRLLAGHESEMEELPVGTTFTLPDSAWIRNRIRDYAGSAPEFEG